MAEEKKTHLYRYYNVKGELLYIGISRSAFKRLSQHKIDSAWVSDELFIKIESFDSRGLALAAEKEAIKTEYPKFNIHHNNGDKPGRLWNTSICSFRHHDAKGRAVTGIRIELLPDTEEIDDSLKSDLIMGKMDRQIYDVVGNARRLYEIIGFEPWTGKFLEIEPYALLDALGFEYGFECFEDLSRMVIDPALKMIMKYSNKSFTYTIKTVDDYVAYIVFSSNREPDPCIMSDQFFTQFFTLFDEI